MKGYHKRRSNLHEEILTHIVPALADGQLKTELKKWTEHKHSLEKSEKSFEAITKLLQEMPESEFENDLHL